MRIAIDVREACRERRTGKGQWTLRLTEELLQRGERLVCVTDQPLPIRWRQMGAQELHVPLTGWRWHTRVASLLRKRKDLDVYLSPTSYIVPYLLGERFPTVPVVHDLIAFRKDPHERRARWIEQFTLRRSVMTARHVLTVSDATKEDLLAQYPDLNPRVVSAVYAGPMRAMSVPSRPDGQTILCIATLSPRKNQARLIEAYAMLPFSIRRQYQLILAGGRGWMDQPILDLVQRTPGVTWKDYVSEGEYESLLSQCTIFALPSLYEGFGIQVLDALSRGIPILTSDRGSLKEVAGSAALTVDPENIPSIAAGLQRLLSDSRLRHDLSLAGPEQAARFSWERTADLVMRALDFSRR